MKPLNLFYEEPDEDRWIKFDRYPRKWIRRMVRGKQRPGGQMMVAINLMKGLDKLGIPYRFNDYSYARKNSSELIGVIGKTHLIFEKKFENPILFGASVYSHPLDCPNLLNENPNIQKILVPGPWMKTKFDEYYGAKNIISWPVGIDTHFWNPDVKNRAKIDFLIYDKVRWQHDKFENELIRPIIAKLSNRNLSHEIIRYGFYEPEQLKEKIAYSKAVIFLCEHETQGIAYQQILSTGTPILAWDRGGYWQDPKYYPNFVKFKPVSSVPYWDNRCGEKFEGINNFENILLKFQQNLENYKPEEYIQENLTLEICTREYIKIYTSLI